MMHTLLLAALSFASAQDFFPMTQGAYWIYRGQVSWQEGEAVKSRDIEWKMQVIETISRADGTVAVLKGHPYDLAWYEPDRKPGNYLLIRTADARYYLIHDSNFDEMFQRVKDPAEPLASLVHEYELILQLPLTEGSRFGEADQLNRSDFMYVWNVESVKRNEYLLTLRTNPDHTLITYKPGVGITSFNYGHHGTVSIVNVKLVKFSR